MVSTIFAGGKDGFFGIFAYFYNVLILIPDIFTGVPEANASGVMIYINFIKVTWNIVLSGDFSLNDISSDSFLSYFTFSFNVLGGAFPAFIALTNQFFTDIEALLLFSYQVILGLTKVEISTENDNIFSFSYKVLLALPEYLIDLSQETGTWLVTNPAAWAHFSYLTFMASGSYVIDIS